MSSLMDSGRLLKDGERQRCEVWTRVMGYHRPVSEFNKGKKGEYYERRFFVEPERVLLHENREGGRARIECAPS